MARPTAGVLTTAGFAQVGSSTKYTKTQGSTAIDAVDLGNGNVGTGVTSVSVASGQPAITSADFAAGLGLHASTGAHPTGAVSLPTSVDSGRNLQYYGITV